MQTKWCYNCKKIKMELEFSPGQFKRDTSECKKCVSIRNKKYREEHKEEAREYQQKYYKENKAEILANNKLYKEKNPEWNKAYQEQYAIDHKDENKKTYKKYRENNKDKIRETKRIYANNKINNDPSFKLRQSVSLAIRIALSENNSSKKGGSILKYLPYTIEELKFHIESLFSAPENLTPDGKVWMTWENWGKYDPKTWNDNDPSTWVWNLDHKIAQKYFPYTLMSDPNFLLCWELDNLRPYSAKKNVEERARPIKG